MGLQMNPKIHLNISLDGTEFANQLRIFKDTPKNTWETVITNIQKIKDRIPHQFNVHITLHPFSAPYINQSIEELYALGIQNFSIGLIEKTIELDKTLENVILRNLNILSKNVIARKYPNIYISLFHNDPKLKSKDQKIYIKNKSGGILGETYNRTKNQGIIEQQIYDIIKTKPESKLKALKQKIYDMHQKNLNKKEESPNVDDFL